MSWKQEVNRRLAAHRSRKSSFTTEPDLPSEARRAASSRAAQAAARVAARYAAAPSYSEMLFEDEIVTGTAPVPAAANPVIQPPRPKQRTAEPLFASLAAVDAVSYPWEPDFGRNHAPEPAVAAFIEPAFEPAQPVAPLSFQSAETQPQASPWELEMPVQTVEPAVVPAASAAVSLEDSFDAWFAQSGPVAEPPAVETTEPAESIHANLIEFPRETAAPRKARTRQADEDYTADTRADGQLSIFEVDPYGANSRYAPAGAADEVAAPVWLGAEWQGMELDNPVEEVDAGAGQAPASAQIELASASRRILAAVVDCALITGAFLAASCVAAANAQHPPTGKFIEMGAAGLLLVTGLLYLAIFCTLAEATPGMRYARISLCTFEDEYPTRARRCGRLGALLLSLLPVGLGVAWAIFDEEHLSWHDRLSRTYLRKC